MRNIKKTVTPDFFSNDTSNFTNWRQYKGPQKRALRKHILDNEQNLLCIYCETKISIQNSHLEHLKPKSLCSTLIFEYQNITVSCNGDHSSPSDDASRKHCGHRKDRPDTLYDENKFLNPVTTDNINKYFNYDLDKFMIESSDKAPSKSEYMIDTLKLNDGGLPIAREKSLEVFIKMLSKIKDIPTRRKKIKFLLNLGSLDQISFLRFKYQKVLDQ